MVRYLYRIKKRYRIKSTLRDPVVRYGTSTPSRTPVNRSSLELSIPYGSWGASPVDLQSARPVWNFGISGSASLNTGDKRGGSLVSFHCSYNP